MLTVAAVSAGFTRDLDACFAQVESLVAEARERGVGLLALPEAAMGGYLSTLGSHGDVADPTRPSRSQPPALRLDGPEVARLRAIAGDLVLCVGLCELAPDEPGADGGGARYNTAVCLTGDAVLGAYRKVHQPLGEHLSYAAGSGFGAVETPVGRIGMQICYDKAFPEAARALALDGAQLVVSMSAWPASRTGAAAVLADDRWTHRFDLLDRARALDNQLFWVASNQAGTFGSLRYVGSAKVVDPGGAVLAHTGTGPGTAVATIDLDGGLTAARGGMYHLRDRRPDAYGAAVSAIPAPLPEPVWERAAASGLRQGAGRA
ncbi:carbon-nitrogen hydrolase family protein [Quadrisphaera oryzae]|uniref:carbon-nitrogen hydrolase family protein n=1 Tax=Quadrisphaera TaxID=317661 RepID=UPI00164760F0|nr:carbon-nitrogen hydrolase family protein [Quadrisphaera sp. RL12-1S]MBC3761868.1 carbon-nitrogen hydrolase family protein [Quadrisphaera sp. RL12-1S]